MRVLFASLATPGHAFALVPLAVAARDAGFDVHFAAGENVHPALAAQGLQPFRPADVFTEIYAEDIEPDLRRLRPDLVIHEWGVPEVAVAAASAGIASLWHGFGRLFPEGIGLERPELTGRPHLDICPPSIQDKDFLASADRIALRPMAFSAPCPDLPAKQWRGPLVYVTLGTAFATAPLLRMLIDSLSELFIELVVCSGPVSPLDIGAVPDNVIVRSSVPQTKLLGLADLVVHHGGSGTTLGALAAGVPQLMLPQGADQFANADAVCEAGAGLRLRPEEVSPAAIIEYAFDLLTGRGCREGASAVAREIIRMPLPYDVARRLPEFC
jgi:UDP:flavonoid glycosyltransferase YjiC (YdhE family)